MLIRTKDLTKAYNGKTVLDKLNLDIAKGQFLAYIGTNGAGKSTTIKMLTGLLKPSRGQIIVKKGLRIGMVFQDSVLDNELTVLDNLKSRFALYKHRDKSRYDELINLLDLKELLKQKYGHLSGGQRRRVDIARALINRPELLFLDEPTTGLDIQTRQAIWALLSQLQKKEGLTIFLTTHYLEEAEHADMTYIIDRGKVLAEGSARKLKERYAKNSLLIQTNQTEAFQGLDYELIEDGRLLFKGLDLAETLDLLSQHRTIITDFDFKKGEMNDVFLTLTGREMI